MSGGGSPRRSGRLLWLLTILAALLAFWLFPERRALHKAREVFQRSRSSAPGAGAAGVAPSGAEGQPAAQPEPAEPPSHLADELNAPDKDIHSDLRIVNDLFEQYRASTHGLDPIGENKDITAALAGKNRLDYAFLPRNHPAINAQGELTDRWGTPFFFHQLGGDEMQIRSAGPDRKLFTADDEVLTPGANPPHL